MDSSASPVQKQKSSLYPEVDFSYPEAPLHPSIPSSSSTSNLYPPETEEVILQIPGAILHLIDKSCSVELACGDFTILRLVQGENVIAVISRVADEIQWPLTKDEATVKVDDSRYFFSLRPAKESGSDSSDDEKPSKKPKSKSEGEEGMLNYGLTFASMGQEMLLKQLDRFLSDYRHFTVQQVSEEAKDKGDKVLDVTVSKETSPAELKGERKEIVEKQCAAYWTTLAPNVEDYSWKMAKLVAVGSGQLIKGILWCGDVTMDRLKWGNEFMKGRMTKAEKEKEISPGTLRRIKRVKRMTKMTEKVASGVLSGVIRVSGFFTSSVANTKAGKKFFSLLPGEIVLATLDGFNRICDALEVAGKNVMATSSNVATELVDHKYGAKAAEATSEGLDAAGHAIGTALAGLRVRKAINLKSLLKPSTVVKSAVKERRSSRKGSK